MLGQTVGWSVAETQQSDTLVYKILQIWLNYLLQLSQRHHRADAFPESLTDLKRTDVISVQPVIVNTQIVMNCTDALQ